MNHRALLDKLREEVSSGKITSDDIKRRLGAAIEKEYSKETPDETFIQACEDFLWEIGAQGQQFVSANSQYRAAIRRETSKERKPAIRFGKLGAALAACLVLLVIGGIRFEWFSQYPVNEGKQAIIQGHSVDIDLIARSMAGNQPFDMVHTGTVEELTGFFGFAPKVASPAQLGAENALYTAFASDELTLLSVQYRTNTRVVATMEVQYYADAEHAWLMVEKHDEGETIALKGTTVYMNAAGKDRSFAWHEDGSLYWLSGPFDREEGLSIIEQMMEVERTP